MTEAQNTLGAAAEQASRQQRALSIVTVAAVAAVYPWFLNADLFMARAVGSTPAIVTAIACIVAIAGAGLIVALSIAIFRAATGDPWVRVISCFAAVTPTFYVATMNYAYLLADGSVTNRIWDTLWLGLGALALTLSWNDVGAAQRRRSQTLVTAHGICAASILILFLAPHIANHLTGLWSAERHIAIMQAVRLVYRNTVIEPVLFVLIAFQIGSGVVLASPRLRGQLPWLSILQAMSGVYLGIFFLGHIEPVFEARFGGTDTNWNWLTANDAGLIANLKRIYLVPHYWAGVIALATHLACGLRDVLLKHGVPFTRAQRGAYATIGLGVLASTLILIGLLGLHLA